MLYHPTNWCDRDVHFCGYKWSKITSKVTLFHCMLSPWGSVHISWCHLFVCAIVLTHSMLCLHDSDVNSGAGVVWSQQLVSRIPPGSIPCMCGPASGSLDSALSCRHKLWLSQCACVCMCAHACQYHYSVVSEMDRQRALLSLKQWTVLFHSLCIKLALGGATQWQYPYLRFAMVTLFCDYSVCCLHLLCLPVPLCSG